MAAALETVHGILYHKPDSMLFYCAFCNRYMYIWSAILSQIERRHHYASYLDEALVSIYLYKYNNIRGSHKGQLFLNIRHPWFCIFCVHNSLFPADERIGVFNESTGKAYLVIEQKDYLRCHILAIENPVFCHASISAGTHTPLCQQVHILKFISGRQPSASVSQYIDHRRGTIRDSAAKPDVIPQELKCLRRIPGLTYILERCA